MKIHWTDIAVEHLLAIHEYIAKDSPEYALRVVDRLTRRSQQIGESPRSGRAVPELELSDVREVIEGPYRIVYRILSSQVDVIAVFHSSRRPPWSQTADG